MLHRAARRGDIEGIQRFVQTAYAHGRPASFIDQFDSDGMTPLYVAVIHGRIETVRTLLNLGANAGIRCRDIPIAHLTLIYASIPRRKEEMLYMLQILIQNGAPLTAKDFEGRTIFHLMAQFGIEESLLQACRDLEKILIQWNAGAGIRNPSSLIDHLLSQEDILGNTPFHTAAKWGSNAAFNTFLLHCSKPTIESIVRRVNQDGNTPLHVAAMFNRTKIASVLVKLDPSCLSLLNVHGKTPIDLSNAYNHKNFVSAMSELLDVRVSDLEMDGWHSDCLPTWIVTSAEFHRHRTYLEGSGIKSLPPENHRRWTVLVNIEKGILHSNIFSDLRWHTTPNKAKAHDVLKVHDFQYLESIRRRCAHLSGDNTEVGFLDGDTVISHDTFYCALLAAGCVNEAVDLIMQRKARNAFCVVRPPGHHAGFRGKVNCPNAPIGSNGFCIFNNVAIGAAYALDVYRHSGIQKVAILDFDVHHGNGTEQCVMNTVEHTDTETLHNNEDDKIIRIRKIWLPWLGEEDQRNIFFASVQGYGRQGHSINDEAAWFYPGSGRTRDNHLGKPSVPEMDFDRGETFPRIINVGINGPGDTSEFWKRCWREKAHQILPAVVDFNPDFIFLSAGFDAHCMDGINGGFIGLESHHFEWLTQKLVEIANLCCEGRMVSVLEGGYAVEGGAASAFASSVAYHVSALNSKTTKKWDPESINIESEVAKEEKLSRSKKRHELSDSDDDSSHASSEICGELDRKQSLHLNSVSSNVYASFMTDGVDSIQNPFQEQSRSKRHREPVDYIALDKAMREETKTEPLGSDFFEKSPPLL